MIAEPSDAPAPAVRHIDSRTVARFGEEWLASDQRAREEAEWTALLHLADGDSTPVPDASEDFGCSPGMLRHRPDPAAMRACVAELKPGGMIAATGPEQVRFLKREPRSVTGGVKR